MAKTKLQGLFEEAQRRFIAGGECYSVFRDLLGHALVVSGGDYGFLAEILDARAHTPGLRLLGCASARWDRETSAFFHEHPSAREIPAAGAPWCGAELMNGCPLICDGPGLDLQRARLAPPDLPSCTSFLAVPVVRAGTAVGVLGITNVPWERSEAAIMDLRPVVNYCCTLIDAYRLEKPTTDDSTETRGIQGPGLFQAG